jgi:hypothetical protein
VVPSLEAVAFVSEPPEFIIRNGLVHVRQRYSDRMCIERVMELHTFLKTIQMAKEAVAEYERKGSAEIIEFPKRAH